MEMPLYLIIVLTIMAILISLLCVYGAVVLRRFLIVMKKVDYLVEDITYKSETLSPILDSLLKVSSYVDVMDDIIKNNAEQIKKVTNDNKVALNKYKSQLEKVLNGK